MRGARDHQVIQHADVEEGEGLLEAGRDGTIGRARLGISAGVVVKEDHCGGVVGKCPLGHDAGMDFAPVDGALKEMLGGKDAVAGVQKHCAKHFVVQVRAAGSEVVAGTGGVGDEPRGAAGDAPRCARRPRGCPLRPWPAGIGPECRWLASLAFSTGGGLATGGRGVCGGGRQWEQADKGQRKNQDAHEASFYEWVALPITKGLVCARGSRKEKGGFRRLSLGLRSALASQGLPGFGCPARGPS